MADGSGTEIPQNGKADAHTIPNEQQCWVLQYKTGRSDWRVEGVYLTHDAVEEANEDLWESLGAEITNTRHGGPASPIQLHGGEHVIRE